MLQKCRVLPLDRSLCLFTRTVMGRRGCVETEIVWLRRGDVEWACVPCRDSWKVSVPIFRGQGHGNGGPSKVRSIRSQDPTMSGTNTIRIVSFYKEAHVDWKADFKVHISKFFIVTIDQLRQSLWRCPQSWLCSSSRYLRREYHEWHLEQSSLPWPATLPAGP